jgi:hypothetical protein
MPASVSFVAQDYVLAKALVDRLERTVNLGKIVHSPLYGSVGCPFTGAASSLGVRANHRRLIVWGLGECVEFVCTASS